MCHLHRPSEQWRRGRTVRRIQPQQALCSRLDRLQDNHYAAIHNGANDRSVIWTGYLRQLPGGAVSPRACNPQHSTVPSVLTPQVCNAPALTEANSPGGGVA